MDIGTISSRYANALFSLAKEEKQDSLVYNDMKILQQNFLSEPTLKNVLNNPIISYNEKEKLLITAGGINVSDIYKRFIQMILKHKRENILQLITYIYIQPRIKHFHSIRQYLSMKKQKTCSSKNWQKRQDALLNFPGR